MSTSATSNLIHKGSLLKGLLTFKLHTTTLMTQSSGDTVQAPQAADSVIAYESAFARYFWLKSFEDILSVFYGIETRL